MADYWEIPEGTNCGRKTWLTTRLGAIIGLVGSAYNVTLFPSETVLGAFQRATTGTVFMATMGAVFGVTTCITSQLRDNPEDPKNYFIGGCASGAIWGARAHSFSTGTAACVGLGTAAYFAKVGKKEGWRFLGPPDL